MALNVSLDQRPFDRINVCGYKDLRVTRLADLGIDAGMETVAEDLTPHLLRQLGARLNIASEPRWLVGQG
jgi:lipoyl(octanoyl) transferase